MGCEPASDRVLRAIRDIPMFSGLDEADQRRIAALGSLRSYRRGDYLWRAGETAEHLTILVNGRVKIVSHSDSGDLILEIFGAGEPVGAIAVYNFIPYPASAICLEPATILSVARRDYFELLDRHPEFARAIIRELTKLILSMARKLEEMRGQRVETRIAQLFLSLAERMGTPARGGIEIPLALTRQEIADLVGTTVETAIRIMSRLGRERILVTGKDRFLIPSRERLARALESRGER